MRDMNKHVSMKKKVLSFFLAFVILFSSMPAELFTFAFASDDNTGASGPAVSVKLTTDPSSLADGSPTEIAANKTDAKLKINVALADNVESADVKITLSENAATLIDREYLTANELSLAKDGESDYKLSFTATEKSKEYSIPLQYPAAEPAENEKLEDIALEITENDVSVTDIVKQPEQTPDPGTEGTEEQPEPDGSDDTATGQGKPGTPSEETNPGTDTGNQPPSEGGGIEQLPPTSNDGNSDSNTPTTTPETDGTTTDTGNQPSMDQNPVEDVVDTVVESMSVQAANAAEDNVEIDADVNLLFKAPDQQTEEGPTDEENPPEDEDSQDSEPVDLTISGPSGDVQIGDDNTFGFSFSASATLRENAEIPEGTDKVSFDLDIKLPNGITANEATKATLTAEPAGATITTSNEENNTLTLTITQQLPDADASGENDVTPAARSGEENSWSYDITVTGLKVSDDFTGGDITINGGGQNITISVNNTNEPEPADKFYSLSIEDVEALQPTERKLPDFTVTTTAEQIAATEEANFQFTLSFALPEGLSLPEGDYSVDNGEIKVGSTTIATCDKLPEGTTANYNSETNVLSLSIAQAGLESTADTALANWTYALAFKGDAFTLAGDFGAAEIAVNATPTDGHADATSATITIEAETVEGEKGTQAAEHKNITQKVSWMDNHDIASRPDPEDFPATELYFRVGSSKWQKLDYTTASSVHLNTLPKVTVKEGTGDNYTIGCDKELPTKLITLGADGQPIPGNELDIHWSFGLPDADGNATPTEVPGYEASVNADGDWVYVKLIDFIFTTQLRWGTMGSNDAVTKAFLNDFALFTGIEGDAGQKLAEEELYKKIDPSDEPSADGTYTVIIHDLPMFNVEDNHLIDYYIGYVGSSQDGMVLGVTLDEGDKITASFNNAGSSNHGNVTDKLYAGGVLTLLLTGKTNFLAHKEWLDQGVEDKSQRPDVSFSLLRYVEGEDITTAAPVPKTDGGYGFVTIELDAAGKNADPQTKVNLALDDLEKYDPEGRRYVYLLREEMTATDDSVNYEKVFGEVEREPEAATETVTDTLPENYGNDGKRRSGDNNLYNGGTISNRIHDNETATLEKVWNAAAYQGQLQDVEVTFELQVDYMNNAGTGWEEKWHPVYDDNGKKITRTQDKITEENLAGWTQTVTVPTYGPLGRDARYKWVEVSVSQGSSNENLYNEETGTFTLTHDGKQVTYTSEAVTKDNTTTITNSVADTVDYEVTKKWENMASSEVIFDLYQLPSGSSVTAKSQPYISFDWNGKTLEINNSGKLSSADALEELGIRFDEPAVQITDEDHSQWDTVFRDLPRFDQNGREYEYVLLERVGDQGIVPNYKTTVADVDGKKTYHTTVINEPGSGTRILVRKEWSDDSDSAHRGAVTIQVYDKDGNTLLNEPVVLQDGVWMQEVGITLPKGQTVDDIYILETTVSLNGQNTSVPLQPYTFGDKDPANTTVPESPLTGDNVVKSYQYETQYHRYEATYSKEKVSGQDLFVVNNRRLGNIDMTVEKTWKDGDGQLRKALAEANDKLEAAGKGTVTPYLELVFEDGYTNVGTISEENGQCYVTLKDSTKTPIYSDDDGTKPVGKYQKLLLDRDELTQTVNFYNLPKYERDGTVVRYNVREVWKYTDEAGIVQYGTIGDAKDYLAKNLDGYADSELKALLDKFSSRVVQTGYTANDENNDEEQTGIQDDQKTVSVTNSLNGSKEIVWHKHWNDQYTYTQNQRPDLYLDIYRVVHNSADANNITVEEVFMDYLWKPDKISKTDEGGTVETEENDPNNWTVTLSNVPKYDDYGFEIVYYAVERTVVKFDTFDYQLGEYVYDGTSLGNRDEITSHVTDGTKDDWALSFDKVKANDDFETGINSDEITADGYPNYALRENGTFVNSLGDTVTIQGQKIWEYMPSGYPAVDFPAVTFEVYQTLDPDGVVPDTAQPVATYTMTEWADAVQSGTYQFTISHTGENNSAVAAENADDGAETAEETELPRYDEQGQMYVYVLREEDATLNDETNVSLDKVFDYVAPETNTYLAKNNYNPPKGEINVQKHLELQTVADDELDNMAFPTIAFKITRSYTGTTDTGTQGPVQDNNWSDTIYWSSADVKAAYEQAEKSGDKVTVTSKDLKFENLPIYAPNGSEYVYTVTETMTIGEGDDAKDFLYGYTASAAKGQLEVADNGYTGFDADQTPTVADLKPQEVGGDGQPTEETQSDDSWATFKDTFTRKQITLTGTKVWDDFNNAFNVRPDENGLTLTVSRYANSQPGLPSGASDAITEQDITSKVDISWEESSPGTNKWTYTIEGKDGFQLDAYAPNGMPWIYKVTEKLEDQSLATIYIATPNGGKVTVSADNDTADKEQLTFPDLKNSMNTDISFQKSWHDQNDQPITQDFLGKELTVTFELQVREKNSGEWKKADEFFKGIFKEEFATIFPKGLDADQEITARINAGEKTWSGKFANLPAVYKLDGESTFRHFEYRVVETSVKYDGLTQDVQISNSGVYSVTDEGHKLVDEATLATSDDKTLFTTTNKLKLGSLSIEKVWVDGSNQYGTRPSEGVAGYTWVASFAVQKKTADGSSWEMVEDAAGNDLVVTLRGDNSDAEASRKATVAGLPTGETYRVVELQPGWNDDGKITDDDIVLDGLYNETYKTTYKDLDPAVGSDEPVMSVTVTNTLTTIKEKDITVVKDWYPELQADDTTREITAVLQYSNDSGTTWTPLKTVKLNAKNGWTYTWEDLPLYYNDSQTPTEYRVIEEGTQADYPFSDVITSTAADGTIVFTLVNIGKTELEVEKIWHGVANVPDIEVQLWRTTGDQAGDKKPEEVAGQKLTLTKDKLTGKFENLQAYDKNGNKYLYFAKETTTGNFATEYVYTSGKTTITNTGKTTVSGTKTWVDNNNAYGTRPTAISLELSCTTDTPADETATWEPVDKQPTWTQSETDNVWNYSYSDLPATDGDGNKYTYKVEEILPTDSEYEGQQEDYNFTNTLKQSISVSGTKTWHDAQGADRPENLTLTLYQKLDGSEEDWTIVENVEPVWTNQNYDVWTYTYNDLQKYNDQGVLYLYKAEETVPAGYDGKTTAGTALEEKHGAVYEYNFENYKRGALEVTKSVSGNRGDKTKEFHFTVTLSGTSSNGEFKSEEFSGTYGDMTFTNGVATFTLKHDETKTALNLPAGLQYAVVEEEANEDGYTTTSSNSEGKIKAGYKATASFNNHRHHSSGGGNDKTKVSVEKEWVTNNGGTPAASVQVQLYRDGKAYADPVTLNAGNGWSHDWTQLDANHVWTVKEVGVTDGFNVYIDRDGNTIVLVNNDIGGPDPEEPPDEPTDIPDPEKPEEEDPPKDPDDPTDTPDDPMDTPDDPTDTPDEPDKPSTDVPDTEKPNTPSNPSNPSSPSTPSHSTTPGTSGTTTTTTTDKSDDKDAPQTGDNTHTRALFALCLASLAGMTVIGVSRKRQRKNDSDQS